MISVTTVEKVLRHLLLVQAAWHCRLAGFVTNIMGAVLSLKRATGARWSVETTMNIIALLRLNNA